jgi:hypothetical protein
MWWHAYWYLIRGRKTWDTCWIDENTDPAQQRAMLEEKLGPVDGFEPIDGAHPLHISEILDGASFHIEFPKRKASQKRMPRVEPMVATQ